MVLGAIAAGIEINLGFVLGAVANYLLLIFAFGYNDIEDREDDAENIFVPQTIGDNLRLISGIPIDRSKYPENSKRFENIFSHGVLTVRQGQITMAFIAFSAIALSYLVGGIPVTIVATLNVVLGYAYSNRMLRLKSRPIVDLLSHCMLLAGLQIVYFLAYPGSKLGLASLLIFIGVSLFSVAGDIENEIRDAIADSQSGIRNSLLLLGDGPLNIFRKILLPVSILLIVSGIALTVFKV